MHTNCAYDYPYAGINIGIDIAIHPMGSTVANVIATCCNAAHCHPQAAGPYGTCVMMRCNGEPAFAGASPAFSAVAFSSSEATDSKQPTSG